jgi:uroporphyrin-III C-methyltransferase
VCAAAALVQDASLPTERRLVSTLASIAADAHAEHIASPAVLIIGDVLGGVSASREQAAMAKSA